ncbi:MAG TPA: cation:dicarboxylase symporter family transporter [Candidatus Saccharimonadales bacterium]|nr:cation:dicarboxylase symporter family transporter [Candidatus Saccharimonadales bacterium]
METTAHEIQHEAHGKKKRTWKNNITLHVFIAIVAAIILGEVDPKLALQMRPLGDLFIKLIRMAIAPIVFLCVSTGVARIGDVRKVGRIGLKALVYFELVTTLALAIGLASVVIFKPGVGVNAQQAGASAADYAAYAGSGKNFTVLGFLLGTVPDNALGAFVRGDLLQVVVIALLFGMAVIGMGERGKAVVNSLDGIMMAFFGIIRIVMRVAPIGAFGAMAFTVGKFGNGALYALSKLIICTYLTEAFYVFVVLGLICRIFKFSLIHFIRYIFDEILLVIGTSSSESVLPQLMVKLEKFGAAREVVDLVLPTGYAFNLGGLALSLPISTLFIAQVYQIPLSFGRLLALVAIMLVTSKGAAGVTGAAFIVLATTIGASGILPIEGLALLFAVDNFLSMARALANVIGNGVATVVVAKLENDFDASKEAATHQA